MGTTASARGVLLLAPVIVSLLSSPQAQAMEETLPLSRIIQYSLQNNSDLKSFRAEKGIHDAGKTRAGLLPNPTIELEGSTGSLTGNSAENSLSLGVSQEFFLAGQRSKRLDVAERELEMYQRQLSDRERLLREEVKNAFHEVLLAEHRVSLAEHSIALNRQLLDVARERLAAGDIPELEMNLVKVELARSESARIEVVKVLGQKRAKLSTLMGSPSGKKIEISGKPESATVEIKALADLKQLALGLRPDLKALEAEKGRGDADIILAEAGKVPNLTAGLFYTHDQRTDATGTGEEKVRDNMLGIRLSMPIPLFDRNQANVQEARARRNSSESRLSAAVRNVELEVETAYADYMNSEKILALYTTNVIPQLDENLKLTQEAYRLGEVGILAVIQEQKKFFEVSEGYLTAQHDRRTALVKLESATATDLSGGAQ